jgi:3-methyladenine DNA glycosylase AlkD
VAETTTRLAVTDEVAAITAALAARRDLSYQDGMRRTVPSALWAHATRVPDIRKTAVEWSRAHKASEPGEVLAVAEALWATGWREEMLVAITLLKPVLPSVGWELVERWSADFENWEQVDHFGDVSGEMLLSRPELLPEVNKLEASAHPWQRRLAIVTLIQAFRRDPSWRPELEAMSERLRGDKHPLVRKAIVWARDRLKKDHLDG